MCSTDPTRPTLIVREPRARQKRGWRLGRPIEDPHKIKRWGYVTAKPSEHLIHVRRGRVTRRSGQGATCFKWPWDSVAVIPTSLQQLQFVADQVTIEKVGVEVCGLAVYRIADPLLAYRVLNFSYPERAQEKLEHTLSAMFVGATRRLVANLGIEDCLRRRKSALAAELLREIAPVVGGEGRIDDATAQGWGVVIDTIEIQEVRVLSEQVFASMQAPFRAALEQQAEQARAQAEREMAERKADHARAIEQARIDTEQLVSERRAQADRERASHQADVRRHSSALAAKERQMDIERKQAEQLASLHSEEQVAQQTAAVEQRRHEAAARARMRDAELAREVAQAELEAHEVLALAARNDASLARMRSELSAEVDERAAAVVRAQGLARAEVERQQAEVHYRQAEAEARRLLAENLPQLAAAFGERIGELKIAHYGGGDQPLAPLVGAVSALVDLAKSG